MDPAAPLAVSRLAAGVGFWLAPRVGLAASLLDPGDRQATYLLRLFAAREGALGLATLAVPQHREALLRAGVAIDTLDAAAGLLAARTVGRRALVLAGVAAGAVALGAASLARAGRAGAGPRGQYAGMRASQ